MKQVTKKLSELKRPEKNIRMHTDKQLIEFRRSVEMFGQIRPIVCDEAGVILAGNGLYETLLSMGKAEAECYVVEGLSEKEKKKLMLADNRIFDLGVDDMKAFDELIADLGDDLDVPGFDDDLLRSLGWTLPIVCRPDYTIIDGFHRWTVSGREPLLSKLGGKVPVVIVDHESESEDMYGTITHNRARGTHLLEPMKAIVKKLLDEGKSVKEISKQLGMRPEEVFRLSDFSKDDFIHMMAQGNTYSRAEILSRI